LQDKIFRKISENAELKIDYPCFSILQKGLLGFGLKYEFA
jgi:hypoxanthine-guanine phosphoribosyltransferase